MQFVYKSIISEAKTNLYRKYKPSAKDPFLLA